MSLNVVTSSISTEFRAGLAAFTTMFRERFHLYGKAYAFDWMIRPIFDVSIAALIYFHGATDLAAYVIVAMAANQLLFTAIYYVGEILDRERVKGTLAGLFLTPCRRITWMAGYAAAGLGETLGRILIILATGVLLFDVRFDPNCATLAIVLPLFLLSLSGLALVLSGIGLLIKRANSLSNLISPIIILLGGVYFPVTELPEPLLWVARVLPLGYATEAITAAAIEGASLADLQSSVIPLAGFAIISPIVGALAFSSLDTLVRRRGEVDLY